MGHTCELCDDGRGADFERVEAGEDVAADYFLGAAVPCEVAVVVYDVLIGWWLAVGCDDQVAPSEAEEI